VVAVGLLVAWLLDRGNEEEPSDMAPQFEVALIGGGSFSLDDHVREDGRPLVLNLWASWCIPCRTEIPTISAYAEDNPEVFVLGVAVEDRPEDSEQFADEVGASYPLGLGDEEFRKNYPSIGLPATYFIDEDGIVVNIINGILTEESLAGGFD
jgi:thiol-disulfide isomerase/thioredoxin